MEKKILLEEKSNIHMGICNELNNTFKKKNKDYGDSFSESYKRLGKISALTRMFDKYSRLENLIINGEKNEVKDESVEDTLLDLANYCIMTVMEMKK